MFPTAAGEFYPEESIAPTLPAGGCFQGQCTGDDDNEEMAPPAGMTLNSGGWFNRGCWYAQEEAILLMRSERGRFKRILTTEFDPTVVTNSASSGTPPVAVPPGTILPMGPSQLGEIIYVSTGNMSVAQPLQFSLPLISAQNTLLINPSLGFCPRARLTVGYRLGTDAMNRQSSIEFTFQGLSNWSVQNSITSQMPFENTLFTGFSPPPPVTSIPNGAPLTSALTNNAPGFTFANYMQYTYNANLNSYEVNFKVAKRLGRDRTVLDARRNLGPGGDSAIPAGMYGGLRLIRYNEQFLWRPRGSIPRRSPVITTSRRKTR